MVRGAAGRLPDSSARLDLVRLAVIRTEDDVRTVVEVAGPVLRHYELPWIGVQRSPHLVEVIDIATGAVLHRISTE